MAFDFLGSFSTKMWATFSSFVSGVLFGQAIGFGPSSFSYDINNHKLTQVHLPNSLDHQRATSMRLDNYYRKRMAKFRTKIVEGAFTIIPAQSQISQISDIDGTAKFKPALTIDDYDTADMVMFLKSKFRRFIKSRFEREEYRLKKCFDFIYAEQENQSDFNRLAFSSTDPERSFTGITDEISRLFAADAFPLVPSQFIKGPDLYHADGEATTYDKTDQQDSIPGQPRRIIYRGLLHISRDPISIQSTTGDLSDSIRELFALQTGVNIDFKNPDA